MSLPKLPQEKEHLVTDNLNMVHYILSKKMGIYPGNTDYDDYFQEGCIGLILSAIRFDESKGFKFSTFAFPNILGSILRYKRDVEPLIAVSRKHKDVLFKVIRYLNQGYSLEEIEQVTGVKSWEVAEALNAKTVQSLEQPIVSEKDGNSTEVGELIACPIDYIEESLSEEHILNTIQQVSDSIKNEMHRNIWEEYIYGMFFGEKFNQRYFSNKYLISQPQVGRILKKYKIEFAKLLNK